MCACMYLCVCMCTYMLIYSWTGSGRVPKELVTVVTVSGEGVRKEGLANTSLCALLYGLDLESRGCFWLSPPTAGNGGTRSWIPSLATERTDKGVVQLPRAPPACTVLGDTCRDHPGPSPCFSSALKWLRSSEGPLGPPAGFWAPLYPPR